MWRISDMWRILDFLLYCQILLKSVDRSCAKTLNVSAIGLLSGNIPDLFNIRESNLK